MRRRAARRRASRFFNLPNGEAVAAALCVIFALGGSGLAYPLLQAVVQGLSLVLLLLVVAQRGTNSIRRIGRLEWAILALLVGVPLLQLVPLAPGWWAALPGHALPAQILAAAGLGATAEPLSLSVADTVQAIIALLPGFALFFAGRQLNRDGRRTLLWTILALAMASAVLGAIQTALGPSAAPSYASTQRGQGIGLFVNRNHQATFLLVALCLSGTLLGARATAGRRAIVGAAMFLCVTGVVATTSRTALALLPLCLATVAIREPWGRRGKGILVVLAGAALAGVFWFNGGIERTLDRFGDGPDARIAFWRTSVDAALAYWPQGSGIGSFTRVYPLFEHREDIGAFIVNHAHQDYLELLIEGGLLAAIGIGLFAVWYVRWGIRLARAAPSSMRREHVSLFWAIAVVLAFSTVEYPLRAAPVMVLFGLLCALLDPPALPDPEVAIPGRARLWRAGVATALAVAGGVWLTLDGWSRYALGFGQPDLAVRLQPLSADAHAALAQTALANGQDSEARAAARAALALAPTNQQALTMLSVASRTSRPADADRLLALSAKLGWRDVVTQSRLIAMYGDNGQAGASMERADALLRSGQMTAPVFKILRAGAVHPAFASALAAQLATNPPWRHDYLSSLDDLDTTTAPAHAQVLRAMARRGTPATIAETGAFVIQLDALDLDDLASEIWRASGGGTIGNPRFADLDRDSTAGSGVFGWHLNAPSGVTVDQTPGSSPTLVIDESVTGLILYQNIFLAPGRYRFSIDLPTTSASTGFGWTVSCQPDGGRIDTGQQLNPARRQLDIVFEVPVRDCPAQRIDLHADGGGTEPLHVVLGNATLTPIIPAY